MEARATEIGAIQAYQSVVVIINWLHHPLLFWLAFSPGRGIPEGQGIPAFRLMRDFPSLSSHPFSLSSFSVTVSNSQATSLKPPAGSVLPTQEFLLH